MKNTNRILAIMLAFALVAGTFILTPQAGFAGDAANGGAPAIEGDGVSSLSHPQTGEEGGQPPAEPGSVEGGSSAAGEDGSSAAGEDGSSAADEDGSAAGTDDPSAAEPPEELAPPASGLTPFDAPGSTGIPDTSWYAQNPADSSLRSARPTNWRVWRKS